MSRTLSSAIAAGLLLTLLIPPLVAAQSGWVIRDQRGIPQGWIQPNPYGTGSYTITDQRGIPQGYLTPNPYGTGGWTLTDPTGRPQRFIAPDPLAPAWPR